MATVQNKEMDILGKLFTRVLGNMEETDYESGRGVPNVRWRYFGKGTKKWYCWTTEKDPRDGSYYFMRFKRVGKTKNYQMVHYEKCTTRKEAKDIAQAQWNQSKA